MKIRNNKNFNVSLMAQHVLVENENGEKAHAGAPARILLPAGALLELTDEEWVPFAKAAEAGLESGAFEMVTAPALTEEEEDTVQADAIAAAKKLLEEAGVLIVPPAEDTEEAELTDEEIEAELQKIDDEKAADEALAKKEATAKKSAATKAANKAAKEKSKGEK